MYYLNNSSKIKRIEINNNKSWLKNLFNIYRDKEKNITSKFKKNYKANLIIADDQLNECSLPGRVRVNGDQ